MPVAQVSQIIGGFNFRHPGASVKRRRRKVKQGPIDPVILRAVQNDKFIFIIYIQIVMFNTAFLGSRGFKILNFSYKWTINCDINKLGYFDPGRV